MKDSLRILQKVSVWNVLGIVNFVLQYKIVKNVSRGIIGLMKNVIGVQLIA